MSHLGHADLSLHGELVTTGRKGRAVGLWPLRHVTSAGTHGSHGDPVSLKTVAVPYIQHFLVSPGELASCSLTSYSYSYSEVMSLLGSPVKNEANSPSTESVKEGRGQCRNGEGKASNEGPVSHLVDIW